MGRPVSSIATLRAMGVFQRFVLDLSRDAEVAMGPSPTANLDIGVLRIVHQDGGVSSSALVEQLALPRSTVARGLARVLDAGFVERDRDPEDARRARWRLTPLGRQKLDLYVAATAESCRRHHPPVEQLLRGYGRAPEVPGTSSPSAVLDAADHLRSAGAAMAHEALQDRAGVALAAAVDRAGLLFVAVRSTSRPGELAEDLGLSPAGVTSLVDRLEGNGLVERERGTDGDGRAIVITLTTSGQRAVDGLRKAFQQHEHRLLDALAMTLTVGATTAEEPHRVTSPRRRDAPALLTVRRRHTGARGSGTAAARSAG